MLIDKLRHWARGHTRAGRYSPLGVAFHWSIAALILFQLWWGWRAGRLMPGADKLEAYAVHSQVGLLILVITLLRMIWRLFIPGPINDADKPGWQSTAAHATHYLFYFCLVGLPITGWAMWSATAAEQPLSVGGIFPWPYLPFEELPRSMRFQIEEWAERAHFAIIVILLILIPAHVGAALKHHFWDGHDVLAGMVPGVGPPRGGLRHRLKRILSRRPSIAG